MPAYKRSNPESGRQNEDESRARVQGKCRPWGGGNVGISCNRIVRGGLAVRLIRRKDLQVETIVEGSHSKKILYFLIHIRILEGLAISFLLQLLQVGLINSYDQLRFVTATESSYNEYNAREREEKDARG